MLLPSIRRKTFAKLSIAAIFAGALMTGSAANAYPTPYQECSSAGFRLCSQSYAIGTPDFNECWNAYVADLCDGL